MELLLFNFLKLKYNGEEQIIQQIYRIGPRQMESKPLYFLKSNSQDGWGYG